MVASLAPPPHLWGRSRPFASSKIDRPVRFVNSIQHSHLYHDWISLSTMMCQGGWVDSKGLIRTEDDPKNAGIRGEERGRRAAGIVNTVTSWFRREDRLLFLLF